MLSQVLWEDSIYVKKFDFLGGNWKALGPTHYSIPLGSCEFLRNVFKVSFQTSKIVVGEWHGILIVCTINSFGIFCQCSNLRCYYDFPLKVPCLSQEGSVNSEGLFSYIPFSSQKLQSWKRVIPHLHLVCVNMSTCNCEDFFPTEGKVDVCNPVVNWLSSSVKKAPGPVYSQCSKDRYFLYY